MHVCKVAINCDLCTITILLEVPAHALFRRTRRRTGSLYHQGADARLDNRSRCKERAVDLVSAFHQGARDRPHVGPLLRFTRPVFTPPRAPTDEGA